MLSSIAQLLLLLPMAPAPAGPAWVGPQGVRSMAVEQLLQARAAFVAADRNGDRALVAAELRAAGVPTREAALCDADANGRLSEEEFLVFYRGLLLNAGREVGVDLDRAVAAILADRRSAAERRAPEPLPNPALRGQPAVERPWTRAGLPDEARARLDLAQATLDARPTRRVGAGALPGDLQVEGSRLAEARGRLGEARLRIQDRDARLAALRSELARPPAAPTVPPEDSSVAGAATPVPAPATPAPGPSTTAPVPGPAIPASGPPGAKIPPAPGPAPAVAASGARPAGVGSPAPTPAVPPPGPVVETGESSKP